MSHITVRQASTADLDVLERFQQGVVAAERPFDSTIDEGPVRYYDIPGLLVSQQAMFAVAELGGEIIGCGFARIEAAKEMLVSFQRRDGVAPGSVSRKRRRDSRLREGGF